MKLEFKIGTTSQYVTVPDKNLLSILEPGEVSASDDEEALVKAALKAPIGAPGLKQIVCPGETVAIVTSDGTRPMPTARVLPALLDELYAAGIRREDVTLVFALGSHRHQTEEERRRLAGERAWSEVACVDSNPEDCIHLGVTSRGTPVDIDRVVANADRRICLGNVEYHYFAGYSGGAKAIMPGTSNRAAIQANHCHMIEDAARTGQLAGNPVREDIEEAAAMVGVDFILNVVLDAHKKIVRAAAGDVIAAHRELCLFLDTLYRKPIPARADIVMVSQGGAPKDLNLYQTQKALDNAKHAVRPGGIIILIGSCREGLGEKTFEEWMTSAPSAHSLVERIGREFCLGGHKAAAIAMVLEKADIYLVSDMDSELVSRMFLTPFTSIRSAYDAAVKKCGCAATVLAMPYGGSTLPCPQDE